MSTYIPDPFSPHKMLCAGSGEPVDNAVAREITAPSEPRPPAHARHDGEMLSTQSPSQAAFQPTAHGDGMLSPDLVSIPPPPGVCTYPNGSTREWGEHHTIEFRSVWAMALDVRLKRIDQALFGTLFQENGYEPFALSAADVPRLSAKMAHWGDKATPNKIALSLKRLARRGHLTNCPADVFRYGIDTKCTPAKLRAQVFARDGHACKHCGSTHALEADHIVPRSRGGETILENLQTLCSPCNMKKGAS